jgi:hypothetical protein
VARLIQMYGVLDGKKFLEGGKRGFHLAAADLQ